MRYTVNKLAKLSGVSPRTLRFYDEISLLKPAFYGDNHYRYYEEEQLLMLQQILFFRELGFPLSDIQRIIGSDDFDKIEALNTHKSILQSSLEKTATLIETIDKTISHIRGKLTMRDEEMYVGFDVEKQKEYENNLVKHQVISEHEANILQEKTKEWKKEDWEEHTRQGDALTNAFLDALRKGLPPRSPEVQAIVLSYHDMIKAFWTPSKRSFLELGQLYQNNPDFKKFYENYSPELMDYILNAIQIFAENQMD